MGDLDLLVGKWTVWVKDWTWEYEFQRDGRVTWRDVHSAEKSSGSWAATSKLVNMWWQGSATRESWQRPLTGSNDHTWYESSYFRGKYRIEKANAPIPPGPGPRPGPQPGPAPQPAPKVIPKADPSEWWIQGVDTFGLPIKAGVSAGKIAVTLLNDQGQVFVLNGFGAGVGEGFDFGIDHLNDILKALIGIGLKVGDIPNVSAKLSKFSFPSRTAGIVLRGGSIKSKYTIQDIRAANHMTVTSGAVSSGGGAEVGIITFFESQMITPPGFAIMMAKIAAGKPWGAYAAVSLGKVALEAGVMKYAITSVDESTSA